jgi:alpha-tubulin suppressor-like RCC1 family protein
VLDGDELRCFGANDAGQLGVDGASGPEPRQVAGSWLAVSTGAEHTCAIAGDRTVRCWGANDSGQLGHEGAAGSSDPSVVPLPCP